MCYAHKPIPQITKTCTFTFTDPWQFVLFVLHSLEREKQERIVVWVNVWSVLSNKAPVFVGVVFWLLCHKVALHFRRTFCQQLSAGRNTKQRRDTSRNGRWAAHLVPKLGESKSKRVFIHLKECPFARAFQAVETKRSQIQGANHVFGRRSATQNRCKHFVDMICNGTQTLPALF